MFPRQLEFANSPAKRKVIYCGRRSGKTHGVTGVAIDAAARFPGLVIPVFERTLTCMAANTFWKSLIDFDSTHKLGIDFHHTLKTATMPNGAVIALLGSDTIEAADKHRGGKHPVGIVDEAGTFRGKVLDYLLTDVLEPATIDHDGTIIVSGTPGIDPAGAWFRLCHNAEWERHHWTLLDNPRLGPAELDDGARLRWRQDWLRRLRARRNWTEATARYLREYMGQWSHDTSDRMFDFDRDRNCISALPVSSDWQYILAMDLGYDDPCAFVVFALRPVDPCLYVVESYEQSGLIPSKVAAHVERLRARYPFMVMVADTGGYGKGVVEEMRQTFSLPIEAAKKTEKRVFTEHVSGELQTGRIKVVAGANRELIDDLISLPRDEDREDEEQQEVADDEAAPETRGSKYRDHLPDAFRYGAREGLRYLGGRGFGDRDAPDPGSDAWYKAQEQELEDAADADYREKHPVDDSWKNKYLQGFED